MSKSAFIYEIRSPASPKVQRGEIQAVDLADARRRLRGMLGVMRLPPNTVIGAKAAIEGDQAKARSAKLRFLLKVLSDHHEWLKGKGEGSRANLSGLNLSGVTLSKKDLSHADLSGADLSGADLNGAVLASANMVRAKLVGSSMRSADLSGADLSEADLRDAVLTSAKLAGADLWRANVKGCVISPKALHAALDCRNK